MELRQLAYFVAVVDEGSFTRAAAEVHVAQPGVSAQIRRLERELGQELLDRSGRTVRLTEVGAAVLPFARAALEAVAGARSAVDDLAGLLRGQVTVGMVVGCASLDLPDLLAGFHRDHPAVAIHLSEANSDRLVADVRDGRLDLALIGSGGATPPGIDTLLVVEEALVAGVGREDPLAARKTVTLEALRDRALISLPKGTGLRTCLDDACAVAGFRPHVAFEASAPHVLAQLAAQGLGVAILPESTAAASASGSGLHALAIVRPRLRARIELAWRSDGPTSPAAGALVAHARRFLTEVSADRRPAA